MDPSAPRNFADPHLYYRELESDCASFFKKSDLLDKARRITDTFAAHNPLTNGAPLVIDLRERPDEKQIDSRATFDIIRYANCWEDSEILCRALDSGPGDRVLSITSAGDNSLDILATGAEVVAVDLSLPQLACLELRIAGFRNLDYPDLLAFLGVREASNRRSTYDDIKADLSDSSRHFWDAHLHLVETGVIFGGKFEDYFAMFRNRLIPLIHSQNTINNLLSEKSQAQRKEFYENVWNSKRWNLLFRVFFSRRVMGWLGRDPEFFRYVEGPVSREILHRAERALKSLPTHDNPYLTFILRGNFGDALPGYLKEERYQAIRDGLDRLTLCRGTVEDAALRWGDEGFDGYNLSDIFEYLDEQTTRAAFKTLLDAANPGARFAYWNMMVPRRGGEYFPDQLHHLEDLSGDLYDQDRAFFYGDFIVEEVSR